MGVTIKKRERDLSFVGLAPAEKPDVLPMGTRVKITQKSYGTWYPVWQPGDVGEVTKHYPASGMHDKRPDQDLYKVQLIAPRSKEHPEAFIHHRDLELVSEDVGA